MALNRSGGQQGSRQSSALRGVQTVSAAEAQLARVAGEGCARHSYLNSLLEASGRHSGRDLADAVHLLCGLVHERSSFRWSVVAFAGRYPLPAA